MRKRRPVEGNIDQIVTAMKKCKNTAQYRRIQCVYLAIVYPDMPTKEIAAVTLFTTRNVNLIFTAYRSKGLAGLVDSRGGRYRENMTLDQEKELLEPFEEESASGSLVVAARIKRAYETKIGREVCESVIYRMLKRHGFRKIVPYRRHKKAKKEAQETFKKTLEI